MRSLGCLHATGPGLGHDCFGHFAVRMIVGGEVMADPHYPGGAEALPVAGDDLGAKATAIALSRWPATPFAMLWIKLAPGPGGSVGGSPSACSGADP